MPTYRHPPPTPSSGSLSSRSNSFSHSSQTERGNKTTTATISNRPSSSTLEFGKRERLGAGGYEKKFPYLFLGGVAAVSLLAHKYWPKGFTYGEKEDWELSDLALRAKHRRLAEKAERAEKAARQVARECSRRRERRGGGGWCEGSDCNAYDDAAEGLRGRGPGYRGGPANCYSYAGEAHGHTGDAIDWDRPRDRRWSSTWCACSESPSCDRGRDCAICGYSVFPSSRASSYDRGELFATAAACRPSVQERDLPEQNLSTPGVSRRGLRYYLERNPPIAESKVLGSTQQSHYDDGRLREIYVYRDRPTWSRRAFLDMSRDGRHTRGHSLDH